MAPVAPPCAIASEPNNSDNSDSTANFRVIDMGPLSGAVCLPWKQHWFERELLDMAGRATVKKYRDTGGLSRQRSPVPSNTHHGDTESQRNSKDGKNLSFYRFEGFLCDSAVRFWLVNDPGDRSSKLNLGHHPGRGGQPGGDARLSTSKLASTAVTATRSRY